MPARWLDSLVEAREWVGYCHRLWLLEHALGNLASCAVAGSVGSALEGTARALYILDDGIHDVHLHAHVIDDSLGAPPPR